MATVFDTNYYSFFDRSFFDNLTIQHRRGHVVEQHDYYAFGLEIPGLSTQANKYQYNPDRYKYNGKELQANEFSDGSGLTWDDYGARMYDPEIARWMTVDPLCEKGRRWSPYAYAFDNPTRFIDPDGMWGDYFNQKGDKIGTDGNDDKKKYVVTDKDQVKAIEKTNKAKGKTQLDKVSSAVELPSDAVLKESLAVIKRTEANGGSKEESSIVTKFGFVQWGPQGPEPTVKDNVQTAPDKLPDLLPGTNSDDVEATIHSHPINVLVANDKAYGQSADLPSDGDVKTFSQYNRNIIAGPLGQLGQVTKNADGTLNIPSRAIGIAIYDRNAKPIIDLTKKAVENIIK